MTKQRRRKRSSGDFTLAERWTPTIATKGFTMVPLVFLENYRALNITASEAMLIVHIASFKWTREAPFPSMSSLAELMGCSERNIRKMCNSLESVGYLQRVGREGRSNQFDLSGLYRKLEGLVRLEDEDQEIRRRVKEMLEEREADGAAESRIPEFERKIEV